LILFQRTSLSGLSSTLWTKFPRIELCRSSHHALLGLSEIVASSR